MRLLSFISAIERAVIAESPMVDGGAWETSRIVNFYHGLARLTLLPRPGMETTGMDSIMGGGTIFLQTFTLADGAVCVKVSLGWKGSDAMPVISVYSTPGSNWKLEASRIASAWLEGPPASVTISTSDMETGELSSLAAMAS